MKQKDIFTVVVIVIFSGVASFLISGRFFNSSKKLLKVQVVDTINPNFPEVDGDGKITVLKDYFNEKSINPTRIIQIGQDSNDKPFNDKKQ